MESLGTFFTGSWRTHFEHLKMLKILMTSRLILILQLGYPYQSVSDLQHVAQTCQKKKKTAVAFFRCWILSDTGLLPFLGMEYWVIFFFFALFIAKWVLLRCPDTIVGDIKCIKKGLHFLSICVGWPVWKVSCCRTLFDYQVVFHYLWPSRYNTFCWFCFLTDNFWCTYCI